MLEGALVTARAFSHLRHLSAGFLLLVRVHEGWSAKAWMISVYRGFMSLVPSIIQKVLDHLSQSLIRRLQHALSDLEMIQLQCWLERHTLLQAGLVHRFENVGRWFRIDLNQNLGPLPIIEA